MNNDFLNHHRPVKNGRNHDGYGHTPPIEDHTLVTRTPVWVYAAVFVFLFFLVGASL